MPSDEAFFVVLDGHGGTKVVDHCRENLHRVRKTKMIQKN